MPFSLEEQKNIIESILSGKKEEFVKLIEPYYEKLFVIVFTLIKDEEVVKDILQDSLISTYKSLSKFRGESKIYTWLYRITINKCYDYLKKRNREKILQVDFELRKENFIYHDLNLENIEQLEGKNNLIDKINQLDIKYRELIIMKYFTGLTYEEIAEIKNIKVGTVKSRIFKAKEILLRFYKNEREKKS